MGKKRDKKGHYKKMQQDQNRAVDISDGLKGFFITCKTGTEKRCIKEIFNVLNEYTEKLYPDIEAHREERDLQLKKEQEEEKKKREQESTEEQKEESKKEPTESNATESLPEPTKPDKPKSMDQLIADEIKDLKKDQKFYVFDLKLKSMIFIKISKPYRDLIDVNNLGDAILTDIHEKDMNILRFCLKLIPIIFVCKASNTNNFYKLIRKEVKQYFTGLKNFTWSMEYKNSNNMLVKRQEVLDLVYNLVNTEDSNCSVDLKHSEYTVFCRVCMDIILFGILHKFNKYRKFACTNALKEPNQEETKEEAKTHDENPPTNPSSQPPSTPKDPPTPSPKTPPNPSTDPTPPAPPPNPAAQEDSQSDIDLI
ncbi:unnamed protein product [Moneuplotes crassus]|uniref:THUMP domain-containing protein n=1 Tax=Euplotes crassus TaxID=5936 RepID=A0AAD1UJ05_EUPCR|nr:unnamed protein product [Moneuplotes crassus]